MGLMELYKITIRLVLLSPLSVSDGFSKYRKPYLTYLYYACPVD